MALITTLVENPTQLTPAQMDEIKDALVDGLLEINTSGIQINGTPLQSSDLSDGANVLLNTSAVDISDNDLQNIKLAEFQDEHDNGNSGTSDTIDWGEGNFQKSTLTGNVTYTFTAPSGPTTLLLRLIQDATGSRTVTWPTIKWPEGTAPTLSTAANAEDIVVLYYNGTDYYGQGVINLS